MRADITLDYFYNGVKNASLQQTYVAHPPVNLEEAVARRIEVLRFTSPPMGVRQMDEVPDRVNAGSLPSLQQEEG